MPFYAPAGIGRRRRRALWPSSVVAVAINTQSAHFDGVDDRIVSAASIAIPAGDFSFVAWIKVPSGGGASSPQILRCSDAFDSTFHALRLDDPIGLRLFSRSDSSFAVATTLDDNIWYHVAGTVNGTTATLYKNGSSIGAGTVLTPNSVTGTLYNGWNTSTAYWTGWMKDCRIFTSGLSAGDVSLLATVASIGKRPSVIGMTATDAQELIAYNYELPWSNATANNVSQVKDTSGTGAHATGANFAGTAASGVDTVVPS